MNKISVSILLGALTLSLFPNKVSAKQLPGGWFVSRSGDSCGANMEYNGPGATSLTILRSLGGEPTIGVVNSGWSAQHRKEYQVTLELNGTAYSGTAMGHTSGAKRGFMVIGSQKFLIDFSKGQRLDVFLNDALIDQLSLKGSAAANRAMDGCLKNVQDELAIARRKEERFAHLPSDPFAEDRSEGPREAEPKDLQRMANSIAGNYPSRALRQGLEGRVEYKVEVLPDGTPGECTVVISSGHESLDTATCTNVKRYAKFHPALDASHKPIKGLYSSGITYRLDNLAPDEPIE